MGKNAHIRKLLNPNKKKGDKQYPFGFKIMLPQMGDNDPVQLTFTGAFDRRKLRNMLRKSLNGKFKTEELDWLIDNFGTPLRTVTKEEFTDMLIKIQEESKDDT